MAYWRRINSEGAAGTEYLTYHDDLRGGTVTIGVSDVVLSQGTQAAVYRVRFGQQASGAMGYADLLVRAWGRDDRADASRYATPGVVAALFADAPSGGGAHWARTADQSGFGKTYVTYNDTATHAVMTLTLSLEAASTAQEHASYAVRFGS